MPDNRKYVEVRATVAQAAAAFTTTFSDYTVDGTALRSNDTPLSVPNTLTGVESVIGLDETEALVRRDATYSRPPASAAVSPARPTGPRRPSRTPPFPA